MKKTLLLFLLSFTNFLFAQRTFETSRSIPKGIEIDVSDGRYQIRIMSDHIIETNFIPKGDSLDLNSHAVVLKPKKAITESSNKGNRIEFATNGIRVQIDKSPFKISYYYKDRYLVSEREGYVKTDSTEILGFQITPDEVLYGGGERVLGMNRRGHRLQLYNRAHYGYETHSELMNYTMPLVISSKRYMLHFDNPEIGFLDLDSKKDNSIHYETIGGRKTYQVIAADKWNKLMQAYADLTGHQPMPPRWALGNFSSRFGYHSQNEVLKTAGLFRKYKIPLDAIVIDIYWFGPKIKGSMGNLEFYKDSFPQPEKMIKRLKDEKVKTVLVTEPFILTTSKKWKETSKNGYLGKKADGSPYTYDFYFGHTGIVDIYNPDAKKWFWNIYKELTKEGVAGWWGDLCEPEVHPSDLIHKTGTADQVHNIYGHDWARMICKGYKKDFPDKRPFILMRAGYSGSQRFGMIPWSGDVNRSWGGLQAQPEIILQMGMQGLAYMHSDLGGFAGGDVFDPELYVRWLQYGTFQPIFRPHAQEHIAPEPVFHDYKTRALAKKAIELRYRLLPYNYTLVFENHAYGMPFSRPLFFEEPENTKLLTYSDAYLWGKDMLIAPVLKKGLKEQKVYFPKNNNWFDFYTGEKYEGGKTQLTHLSPDHIPVFVRAGAFIPMTEVVQSTDDYKTDHFQVHYYYDPAMLKSTGYIYNDDGKTPEPLKKHINEYISFQAKNSEKEIQLTMLHKTGSQFKSPPKKIELVIHEITKPQSVSEKNYQWDPVKRTLKLNLTLDQSKEIQIHL